MDERYDESTLTHYGVVGMKWGIRRGNVSMAYYKSGKKVAKLEKRANKAARKFDKKAKSRFADNDTVVTKMRKARKKQIKLEKFQRAREKAFADVDRKDIDRGKAMLDEYMKKKRR